MRALNVPAPGRHNRPCTSPAATSSITVFPLVTVSERNCYDVRVSNIKLMHTLPVGGDPDAATRIADTLTGHPDPEVSGEAWLMVGTAKYVAPEQVEAARKKAAAPKKSRKKLIIIAVVLLLGGGGNDRLRGDGVHSLARMRKRRFSRREHVVDDRHLRRIRLDPERSLFGELSHRSEQTQGFSRSCFHRRFA